MNLIREDYLKLIRPYYDVDLIKVITGIRRSGKSVLNVSNSLRLKSGLCKTSQSPNDKFI